MASLVYLKHKNGTTYVYENVSYWDNDLKNDLDMKRLRIHSSAAMDGRMFIQYIALIFSSQIKNIMDKAGWFKSHNMQEVIDEMKSLRMVSVEGKRKQIYTTATAFQKEIIELFGINIG